MEGSRTPVLGMGSHRHGAVIGKSLPLSYIQRLPFWMLSQRFVNFVEGSRPARGSPVRNARTRPSPAAWLSMAPDGYRLQFHGLLQQLASPGAFNNLLWQLSQKDWVVYAKAPFGGAEHVLNYLARYTHRVAISNHRLVAFQDDRVSFRWRDYAHGGKKKVMTVSAHEFLRRFLLHVLPGGLVRIRHFGLFANRRRGAALERCRVLLGTAPCLDPPEPPTLRCPACSGIMLVVERLTHAQLHFRANLVPSEPRRCGDDSS
jgi:hypothetical protein